jgi:hypothetical protein
MRISVHAGRLCYPLTLSRLMKLCNRNGLRTLMAVRILRHSIDTESESEPPLKLKSVC